MGLRRVDLVTKTVIDDDVPYVHGVMSLPPETWADLTDRGYPGIGYWQDEIITYEFDAMTHRVGDEVLTLDFERKVVVVSYALVDLTPDEIAAANNALIQTMTIAVQTRLDDFARTRHYDDIKSLSDFAGDEDPIFNSEGTYGKHVRSRTWRFAINIMEDVKAGIRPAPTCYEDIEAELPELKWPDTV